MSLALNLYSSQQVRQLDRIAIDEFKIPGFTLMKRAGKATFDALIKTYPDFKTLCVACGQGNNGGDGYVIATLAVEAGKQVKVIQLGDVSSIQGDALKAREAYLQKGSEAVVDYSDSCTENFSDKDELLDCDIIVDAIFGTGLTRNVEGEWARLVEAINQSKANVIAVDIPSGLDADTGSILGCAIKADLTVTYIGLKKGLVTGKARDYVGYLAFYDLSIPSAVYKRLPDQSDTKTIPDLIILSSLKPRARTSHKGTHGHVLIVGGACGMSGAVRIAGEASLRTGAGLVSIATHPAHADFINLSRPELMVSGVEQSEALSPLIERANVIAIGPGLGQSDWAKDLLLAVLESNKRMVLDADALNLLSLRSKTSLPKLEHCIVTPHPAEAGRLLGVTTPEIERDRYAAAEKIAIKFRCVCVFKGAGTLISDGVKTSVCTAGNPGMATAGMGDTLTGIIASLLAQGIALFEAAEVGVYLHARAADEAAKNGERGLIASDLLPQIRKLVNP